MTRLLTPLLLLASTATAHFSMTLPKPLGDSDDNEATAPCGGYTASSSSAATDFYVEGDAIGMENGHPQTNWLFRATLDQTAASGWTQLFPIVMQTGLGNFCEPKVAAPGNWTGKRGVVSVVAHSPDGLLYTVSFPPSTRLHLCPHQPPEVSHEILNSGNMFTRSEITLTHTRSAPQ